ncbi:hypothetical protein ACFFK7_13730 [Pseudoalteromonas xiamenensis]|uniref:hypothetical protein n=1 Tax=Pseudoalteromonas xiamenensis TaxID=882626 RepID=UPI0035E53383
MPFNKRLFALTTILILAGCSSTPVPLGQAERLYDFDHQVHYTQTRYSDESFLVSIDSDSYAHFQQQSTFLLRHAERLCQANDPVLTIKNGIQDFDRFPQKIRPFQPNLLVWIRCEKPKPLSIEMLKNTGDNSTAKP